MAVNPFDRAAQAQFTNTYTPIPFQEIMQAGAARQQRYDVNRSAYEQMAAEAENLQYIPKSEDEKYITGTVLPTMQEISDTYATQDYGDPEVVRNINRQIRENISRSRVAKIQRSAQGYAQYKDLEGKMLASGKTPFKPFDPTDYDSSISGIFSDSPVATLDYEGALQNFFSQVGEEYLGDRPTQYGRIGSFHGKSLNKLQDYANENVAVAASNPAIQQYLEGLGIDPQNTEAVREVLMREAPRFETSRMTGSYERPEATDTEYGTTPFNLRTQPSKFQGTSYKDLQKQSVDYNTQLEALQRNLIIADNNGQSAVVQGIQNQIAALNEEYQDVVFWRDEVNNRVLNTYKESINSNVDNFKSNLSFITDSNARNKWKEAYSNAIMKNVTEEGFQNVNFAAEVNKEYTELYGQDEDYTKWDRAIGYRSGDLSKAINKSYRQAKVLNENINSKREQEWSQLRTQGISEETFLLPPIENSTDEKTFPELRELTRTIKLTSEDFLGEVVSSSDEKMKNKAKALDFLHNANNIRIISASPTDTKSPYIYVIAENKNSDGSVKSDVGYKIRLSEGQEKAIAQTFFRKGDLYNGIRWYNPELAKNVEKTFSNNKRPQNISFDVSTPQGTYSLDYELQNGQYYLTYNASVVAGPFNDKEDIKDDIYNRYARALNLNVSNQ